MMISGPLLKTHSEPKKESKSSSRHYLYLKKWREKPENYVRTLEWNRQSARRRRLIEKHNATARYTTGDARPENGAIFAAGDQDDCPIPHRPLRQ